MYITIYINYVYGPKVKILKIFEKLWKILMKNFYPDTNHDKYPKVFQTIGCNDYKYAD